MIDFFGTLDHMKFSVWVMQSNSIWSFPTFLFLHTLGMSIVAGLSAMIDLVLLGFWPKMPIKPLGRLYPLMWIGFWINAVTGTVMLIADATAKLTNWDFYVKMGFVFAGVALLRVMQKKVFTDPGLDKAPVSGSAGESGGALSSAGFARLRRGGCWLMSVRFRGCRGLRIVSYSCGGAAHGAAPHRIILRCRGTGSTWLRRLPS